MTNNTRMSKFTPANRMMASAGTWTQTVASNVWSMNRTAADAAFTMCIPLAIDSNSAPLQGCRLASAEIMYAITGAAMDAITSIKLFKDTFNANGTINSSAEVTAVTFNAAQDTDAEQKTQDEHRVIMTLTNPPFIDNDEAYHIEIVVDGSAAGVMVYYGTIVNYTLRV